MGNRGIPPRRDSRGSPFQLPTRLADGLGLESGLRLCSQCLCAPARFHPGFGSPAPALRKQPRFRLQISGNLSLPAPSVRGRKFPQSARLWRSASVPMKCSQAVGTCYPRHMAGPELNSPVRWIKGGRGQPQSKTQALSIGLRKTEGFGLRLSSAPIAFSPEPCPSHAVAHSPYPTFPRTGLSRHHAASVLARL